MKFIGKEMIPAPKVKDVVLEQPEWNKLYLNLLKDIRILY
jgi:serine/threonine-protein kinase RIO1